MKKIQEVISNCIDCKFAKQFVEDGGNTDYVLVCTKKDDEVDKEDAEEVYNKVFLIFRHYNKIKNSLTIPIPNNCPLETYGDESK